MTVSDRRVAVAGGGVAATGLVLTGLATEHLLREHTLMTSVLGGVLPIGLGVGTVAGGLWIARSGVLWAELRWLLGWWVGALVSASLLGFVGILYLQAHGVVTVDGEYVVLNNALAGSIAGLLVGRYFVRSRRTAEALSTQRDRLAVLNRLLRHDIRNDMSVVLGWLAVLRDHVDDRGADILDRVESSSEHVVDLTELARDYSAVIVGQSDPELGPIDLGAVVREELETRRDAYPEAEFRVDVLPSVTIRANRMIGSAIRNVLNNAVQHNDAEPPVVGISVLERSDRVEVQVSDNGPGIPDDRKESVFGAADEPLDTPGTGIGLSLVRTLITEYGGRVWVTDNEPRGTIVHMTVPLADEET